jgi:hypothetical protein
MLATPQPVRYLIGRIVERLVFDRYADAAVERKAALQQKRVAVDAEQKVLLRRAQVPNSQTRGTSI